MHLESLGPDLWAVEHPLFMPGAVDSKGRMTVVRLANGEMALHSVVPMNDALFAELETLGKVKHLIAPSKLHYLHLAGVQNWFPGATTWAAPGLHTKRPELRIDRVLWPKRPPWSDEFEPLFVEGIPWMNEMVFFHHASKSLLVSDLLCNVHDVCNVQSRLVFLAYGILGKLKQSPRVHYNTEDRSAAAKVVEKILAWDFERLVPAHGRVISDDAHQVVEQALATMARG